MAAFYLVCLAVFARIFTLPVDEGLRPWYLGLQAAFLLLYSLVWWRPLQPRVLGLVFGLQSLIVFAMLSLEPERDFVTALYVALSYQSALILRGRARWIWVGVFVILIGFSLMVQLAPLRGLAFALTPMSAAIVIPAYVVAREQLEHSRAESGRMVAQLEATHLRLEAYAGQVEELAGMEERNRLARELHDSVSQTMFSVLLGTRSAQLLLEKDPQAVGPQLEHLQELSQNALRHMRGLIADLDTGTGAE